MESAQPKRPLEGVEAEVLDASTKREWWRAIKAITRLARNTDDTTQVFEIIHSLSGDCVQRTYERACKLPEGRKLIREKRSLNVLLRDPDRLAAMAEGSLGREYLRFMTEGELSAQGLIGAQDAVRVNDELPGYDPNPDRFYIERRLVEMHDLWHVLSGYGRDDTGELANLWFSYGQFGQLGMGFIALFGTLDGPARPGWYGFMRTAYRRGRKAKFLVATPMEQMLELPIDEARARLDIEPPLVAHPGGILTGNRAETGIGNGPLAAPP